MLLPTPCDKKDLSMKGPSHVGMCKKWGRTQAKVASSCPPTRVQCAAMTRSPTAKAPTEPHRCGCAAAPPACTGEWLRGRQPSRSSLEKAELMNTNSIFSICCTWGCAQPLQEPLPSPQLAQISLARSALACPNSSFWASISWRRPSPQRHRPPNIPN